MSSSEPAADRVAGDAGVRELPLVVVQVAHPALGLVGRGAVGVEQPDADVGLAAPCPGDFAAACSGAGLDRGLQHDARNVRRRCC